MLRVRLSLIERRPMGRRSDQERTRDLKTLRRYCRFSQVRSRHRRTRVPFRLNCNVRDVVERCRYDAGHHAGRARVCD
jgi:hypothetical protein